MVQYHYGGIIQLEVRISEQKLLHLVQEGGQRLTWLSLALGIEGKRK